jgi:hypothetical protein
MLQRLGLGMASRAARAPTLRTAVQRRFASTGGSQTENEFVRERRHIVEHAASTSGA